ncbi:MAG: hypothetical protein ACI4JF_03000 [Oscillospiraceae bacterium]
MVKCALCGKKYEGEVCPDCGGDVVSPDFAAEMFPEYDEHDTAESFAENKDAIYRRNVLIAQETALVEQRKQEETVQLREDKLNEITDNVKFERFSKTMRLALIIVLICCITVAALFFIRSTERKSDVTSEPVEIAAQTDVVTIITTKAPVTEAAKTQALTEEIIEETVEEIAEETAAPMKYDPLVASENQYYFENEKLSATLEFTDIHSARCYWSLVKKQDIREEDYVLFAEMNVKNVSDEPITFAPQALELMGGSSTYCIDTPISEDGLGVPTAGDPFELAPDTAQTIQLAFVCDGSEKEVYKVSSLEYADFEESCPDMSGLVFADAADGYMVQESLLKDLGSTEKLNAPLTPQAGEYSVTTDVMSYCFTVKRSANPNYVIVKMRMQNLTNYARYVHPLRFSLKYINVRGEEYSRSFYDLSCDESLLYKVEVSELSEQIIPEAEGTIYDKPMYLTMHPDGYAEYTFYFHVQETDGDIVALEYDAEDAVYEYGQDKFRVEMNV